MFEFVVYIFIWTGTLSSAEINQVLRVQFVRLCGTSWCRSSSPVGAKYSFTFNKQNEVYFGRLIFRRRLLKFISGYRYYVALGRDFVMRFKTFNFMYASEEF